MKKISMLLLVFILLSVLASCQQDIAENPSADDQSMQESEEGAENTLNGESIEATEKNTENVKDPICEYYDYVLNAKSLEEYDAKIDPITILRTFPGDQNADFSALGFDLNRIVHEKGKDKEGNYQPYERLEIIYHSELCPNEIHSSLCDFNLVILTDSSRTWNVTENTSLVREIEGLRIYRAVGLKGRAFYEIRISDSTIVILHIPIQVPELVNEAKEEQLLDQAIALAKTVRSTLEQSNTN